MNPAETERAVWIDFEGNQNRNPTLLGVLVETELRQWIVEPTFAPCANQRPEVRFQKLTTVAAELIRRCDEEDRLIVSWSEHDYHLLEPALAQAGPGTLRRRYRNAIFTASRWRAALGPDKASGNALEAYMQQLGWTVPEAVGTGIVGAALRTIRPGLEGGAKWGTLTPGQREKWKRVLAHNRHDLKGMARVTGEASRRLWKWLGWHPEADH